MNVRKHVSAKWVIALILLFSTFIFAENLSTFDELLSKIKTYEYGQSRENLNHLKNIINSAIDTPDDLAKIQAGMISFLKSDATLAGKHFICEQLSIIGNEKATPILVDMLKEAKTSDIARYTLERIPGDKMDSALRTELSRSTGLAKIGIINTIGQRKDGTSVRDLGKLLKDRDEQTALAASAALGNIADEQCANILKEAIPNLSGKVRDQTLDSYLKCADQMTAVGNVNAATEIYSHVFRTEFPVMPRIAAFRGMVTVAGEKGSDIILNVIRNGDEQPEVLSAALSYIQLLPESVEMKDIAAELPNLSDTGKIVLLTALANRGDGSALKYVRDAASDEAVDVRCAAYKSLAKSGDESDIDLFLQAATSGERDERTIARESLYRLQGKDVDKSILSKIPTADDAMKAELIAAIEHRIISDTTPMLLELAKAPSSKIRTAAFKSLAAMAEPEHFSAILRLLKNTKSNADRTRLERTIVAVAHKFPPNTSPADEILGALKTDENIETRSSLIKVLGIIGEEHTLPVLRTFLTDKNEDIQTAAIYALSDWPAPAPLNELLKMAQSSQNEVHQILALRGCIQLLGLKNDIPLDEIIDGYLAAMKLAQGIQEKRMVLSGLSKIRSLRAYDIIVGYLDNDELRPEAEVAALQLSGSMSWDHPDRAKTVLSTLVESTKNEQVRSDARELLIQLTQ